MPLASRAPVRIRILDSLDSERIDMTKAQQLVAQYIEGKRARLGAKVQRPRPSTPDERRWQWNASFAAPRQPHSAPGKPRFYGVAWQGGSNADMCSEAAIAVCAALKVAGKHATMTKHGSSFKLTDDPRS